MQSNFSEVEQRVKRYWFKDGLGELVGGGMILLIGLYFAGQEWLPEGSMGRTFCTKQPYSPGHWRGAGNALAGQCIKDASHVSTNRLCGI